MFEVVSFLVLTRYWRPRGQEVVLEADEGEAPGQAEHIAR